MALNPIPLNQCAWNDYLSAQEASLPHLADVEDVTIRVIRIMGGNPGEMQLQGTNTYIVGTGKSRILIDTGQGMPIWATNITKILKERDLEISHVLLTHWHGDHTEGVPDLIAYDPRLTSRIYKNQPSPGQQPIHDGQIFETEGAVIRAIFTPGHAVDHMCFILEEENAMFTGDNVLGHGYSVAEDLGEYMKSLEIMRSQNCQFGYPAHGIKILNLPRTIRLYIRHKEQRERQIYHALTKVTRTDHNAKGSLTARELVHALHGEIPEELFKNAFEPFLTESLWKLAEERKVGFEVVRGRRRWFLNKRAWQVSSAA
ncbi:Beta-lactamase-like protein 2 [Penicillium brasilianum]|uniref:Beta-lactamase-like protein 2 n=1 Tax=Penicillium brasilianum TaxID=104259 RepID=A0A1S9S0H8_PENBI|nr:Beta-lactamase-like protein 2 [Penicillium brasilianum]